MAGSFRELVAWQKAMDFVMQVYVATEAFPQRELYGLTSQVRRASVSVPSNIAEGKGRLSKKEFVQFLARARGSLLESQTQLEISMRLGYLAEREFSELDGRASEVGRILNGLIHRFRGAEMNADNHDRNPEP